MSYNWCHGPNCHTNHTQSRIRGSGDNNFCTLNCQNDWWAEHGTRVVDYIGRVKEPIVLTAENAWRQVWNRAHWEDNSVPRYIERNMITQEERPCEQG